MESHEPITPLKAALVSITAFGISLAEISEVLQVTVLLLGAVSALVGIVNGIKNKK